MDTEIDNLMELSLDEIIKLKRTMAKSNEYHRVQQENHNSDNESDQEYLTLDVPENELEQFTKDKTSNTDLREKLNKSSEIGTLPSSGSQQWRVLAPNLNRLPGMPPLIPEETLQCQENRNFINKRKNNQNYQNYQHNRGGINGGIKHGRVQRNNQNIKYKQRVQNNCNPSVNNFSISVPSSSVNCKKSPMINFNAGRRLHEMDEFFKFGNVNNEARKVLNVATSAINQIEKTSNAHQQAFKDALTQITNAFLHNSPKDSYNTTHKTIYDMEVQDKIRAIQNKPIDIASVGVNPGKDGKGMNSDINPRSSNISMHYRFGQY